MAIGSPPPPDEGPRSNLRTSARSAWIGGGLLIGSLVVVGAFAWRMLRRSDTPPPRAAPAAETRAAAQAPREPVADDPTFSQRLLAAAAAAQRQVTITARVAKESRELVKSLELIGGFEAAAALASGDFTADGSVAVSIPAAWPRLRALRIVRRDGTFVLMRDLALVGTDLDLGELPLPAGGAIGGRVRSRDGGPLEGARVALFDVTDEPFPAALPDDGALGVATSGADGAFSFTSVPERHVRVEVSGVEGRANAVVEEAEIFGPPLEIALPPAASIRGRLVDVGGEPVEGGRVVARMAGPRELSAQRSAPSRRDGAFELDALAPGYYTLFAIAAGFAPQTVARAHTDVEGLAIRLDRLASARLALVNAPAQLRAPVVWRTVEPLGAAFRRTSPAELAWSAGRELVLEGIPPGRQALEIALPGAAPVVTTVATFAANQATELGTLSLQRGAELSLRVTDREGRPLRARVALAAPQWSSNAGRKDLFTLDHDERVTDADGRCVWPDLPAGRRVVAARAIAASLAGASGADAAAEVEIPVSGRVEAGPLVIAPAGAVAGRVRAKKGPPLDGMLVEVEGGGATRSATTDVDGRYEVRGLPPGRYVVTVIRRDEAPPTDLGAALEPRENPTANVEVVVGETTPRDFDLEID
jgi:carboxypeptidase family protein